MLMVIIMEMFVWIDAHIYYDSIAEVKVCSQIAGDECDV
jgi:hypothetical protein